MRAAILHAHGAVPELGEFRRPGAADGAEVARGRGGGDEPGRRPDRERARSRSSATSRRTSPARRASAGARTAVLVYFDCSREPFGAFAERTLIDAGSGYPLPDGLDPALAVCLGVSGLAAWLGLEWRGRLAARRDRARARRERRRRPDRACRRRSCSARGASSRRRATSARGRSERARVGSAPTRSVAGCDGAPSTSSSALREASGGDGYDLVLDPLWGEPAAGGDRGARRRTAGSSTSASRPAPRSRSARRGPLEADRPARLHELHRPEERRRPRTSGMTRHARDGELRGRDRAAAASTTCPTPGSARATSPHRKLVIVP